MGQPVATVKVRAEEIEGLRELISEVIAAEGERLIPRQFLADVEALRRSPAGAVIRMEGDIKRLQEGQEALWKGQEALRTEFRGGLANLEKVMEARFEGLDKSISLLRIYAFTMFGLLFSMVTALVIKTFF